MSLRYAGDDCLFAPRKQQVKWDLNVHRLPLNIGDRMTCELFPLAVAPDSEIQAFEQFMKDRKALKRKVGVTMVDGTVRNGKMFSWDKVSELRQKLSLKPSEWLTANGVPLMPSSSLGASVPDFADTGKVELVVMPQEQVEAQLQERSQAQAASLDLHAPLVLANDVQIPRLGLGLYKVTTEEVPEVIQSAIAAGYRHFDTAALYKNEEAIGAALAASGVPRSELFITSKLPPGATCVDDEIRASLSKLQLDYLDLYLVHTPAGRKGRDATWRGMEAVLKAGLTRAIGVCNYGVHQLSALLQSGVEVVPMVNQIEVSPFVQRDDIIKFCGEHKIAVEAYSPLCKASRLQDPRLTMVGSKYNCTPAQLLLRWGLQRNLVLIPKTVNANRMAENMASLDDSIDIDAEGMSIMSRWDENFVTGWDPTADE